MGWIRYDLPEMEPKEQFKVKLQFECNVAVAALKEVKIQARISYFGDIQVNHSYSFTNKGATLEGDLNRADYDEFGIRGGKNASRNMGVTFPLKSWNISRGDKIGNVTTSRANYDWKDNELDLQPRFPVLGGWQYYLESGSNLLSNFRVQNEENVFVAEIDFGSVFLGTIKKEIELEIVGPVGSYDLSVEGEQTEKGLFFGLLDFYGRETLKIKKKLELTDKPAVLKVEYKISYLSLVARCLLLISFFFLIFLGLICYYRLGEKQKIE